MNRRAIKIAILGFAIIAATLLTLAGPVVILRSGPSIPLEPRPARPLAMDSW